MGREDFTPPTSFGGGALRGDRRLRSRSRCATSTTARPWPSSPTRRAGSATSAGWAVAQRIEAAGRLVRGLHGPLDGTYDVVWSSMALHHVRDLDGLLRALQDLLVDVA